MRRRRFGADVVDGGVDFVLHATAAERVALVLSDRELPMDGSPDRGFHLRVPGLGAGALYRFRVDGGAMLYPDPASRFQPEGPHGPSMVIDPNTYAWKDQSNRGVQLEGQVIYELHIGTFTREGTFAAAARELPRLAELGITLLEVMPVNGFPGRFGWGYDGVNLYAPFAGYGTPDELRALVDAAHACGLGIILDVVYNHLGPDGNYLPALWKELFSAGRDNDWGQSLNFDGPGSEPIRAFFVDNAAYWIDELHFDGLRLDATQSIIDDSPDHVVAELVAAARAAAGNRAIVVVAENEPEHSVFVRAPADGGYGCDALWNDDLHHAAVVAATGRRAAYFTDTLGTPQELISGLKWGPLFQGQHYSWQKQTRGTPSLDLPASRYVVFLHNHDQIANAPGSMRVGSATSPGRLRALSTLFLLAPGTPMLFQGEEYDASTPFHYFADHGPELAALVRQGRTKELQQFPCLRDPGAIGAMLDPAAPATFEQCKLDPAERERNQGSLARTRDLLSLRRSDPVFRAQRADRMHGAVLGPEAFCLRFFGAGGDDRLLLVNLGGHLPLVHAAEPLLAPPYGCRWTLLFSSEDVRYGGTGTPPLDTTPYPYLPGHATLVLTALPRPKEPLV